VQRADRPWYSEVFDRDEWLKGVAFAIPPDQTRKEVDFLTTALDLSPGASVLDLACGHGRHSLELSRRGFFVCGVDLSERSLSIGKEAAEAEGACPRFVRADMRQIGFTESFDAAINIWSSFGYLESESEDRRVVEEVGRALRPGGSFVVDVLNLSWLMDNQHWSGRHESPAGGTVHTSREFDPVRRQLWASWRFGPCAGVTTNEVVLAIRAYGYWQLTGMLEDCGLLVDGTWGSLDGRERVRSSPRMVLRAHKAV
jgi:SAM-dependent methyltransferase